MPLTSSSPNDDETPKDVKGKAAIRDYLGLGTINELETLVEGKLVKPDYELFHEKCIVPLRNEASESGRLRRRGPNFKAYEMLLIADEQGAGIYNDPQLTDEDRADWGTEEWFCWILSKLTRNFSDSRDGLFFRRPDINAHKKRVVVWTFLGYLNYLNAPSRRAYEERYKANKKRKADQAAADNDSDNDEASDDDNSSDHGEGFMNNLTDEERRALEEEEAQMQALAALSTDNDNGEPLHGQRQTQMRDLLSKAKVDPTVADQLIHGRQERLTAAQLMLFERQSNEFNSGERFWVFTYIKTLIDNVGAPESIEESLQVAGEELDAALDGEQTAWQVVVENIGDGDELPFARVDDAVKDSYNNNTKLIDNPRFHHLQGPKGYSHACKQLRISRRNPRFLCMPVGRPFKFWQPAAICWMLDMSAEDLKGCLLADGMGTGKTWELVGFLIKKLMTRRGQPQNAGPAKPTLLVVMPATLQQWERELALICNKYFRVVKYYGEYSQYGLVKGTLTRDHEVFDSNNKNTAKTIILTTTKTLARRHGPGPLSTMRVKAGWSAAQVEANYLKPPEVRGQWKHDLYQLFEYVVVDEAHTVKNPETAGHATLSWLKPSFTILATGTPAPNRADDWLGLLKLMEAPQDVIDGVLAERGEDFMPYTGPKDDDDQSIRALRASSAMFQKYILSDEMRLDPLTQGKRLADVQQAISLKRGFPSEIDGKGRIGSDVPPLVARNMVFTYTEAEFQAYSSAAKGPNQKLIRVDDKGKVVWNFAAVRELLLYSLWPGFAVVERRLDAKKCAQVLKVAEEEHADDPLFLLNWLLKQYSGVTGEAFTNSSKDEMLTFLLRNAPKMVGVLGVLKDVVVLHQNKMLLFCSIPAQMVYVMAILKACSVSASCFHAGLKDKQRMALIDEFNMKDTPSVMVTSPALAGIGINLQERCHQVLFLDPTMSPGLWKQAVCRVHRVKQTNPVQALTCVSGRTFNEKQLDNNFRKALPGVLSSLDIGVFGGELGEDEFGETIIELGDWAVLDDGTLIQATSPRAAGKKIMRGAEVLREILKIDGGSNIRWAQPDPMDVA